MMQFTMSGTMLRFALDYGDEDVPETFSMAFSVTGERADREEAQADARGSFILVRRRRYRHA